MGIIAPASNIKRDLLDAGCLSLRQLGYRPFYFDSILNQELYFAGSVERRVRELEEMFLRDEVKAIIYAAVGLSAYDHERSMKQPVKYDVVIDCAGSESALEQACELARPGGTVLLLSVYWGKLVLPGMRVGLKELRILGSMTYSCHAAGRDVDSAAALLARHPELAKAIVTHRFSLEQARLAFQTAGDRAAGAVKVVLHP